VCVAHLGKCCCDICYGGTRKLFRKTEIFSIEVYRFFIIQRIGLKGIDCQTLHRSEILYSSKFLQSTELTSSDRIK
jgi:hypothetical protein